LIRPADPFRIISKGPPAAATAVSIHLHPAAADIPDWLARFSPTLKDLPPAVWTFLWTFFGFSLDIRQFQDKNRHGELLASVI
jgi:hypothetical protein